MSNDSPNTPAAKPANNPVSPSAGSAPITLPPSFFNSFWSSDYRTGLDVLFRQLEAGVIENDEVADFIDSQARAHHSLAASLQESNVSPNANSTSSLQHTLTVLRGGATARGEAHRALAMELQEHILVPFNGWKARHADRIEEARDDMLGRSGVVSSWEKEVNKLMGLRQAYSNKMRLADESEDDAQFAPSGAALKSPESYTSSPGGLKRSGTVADRISEKLRRASSTHSRSSSVASTGASDKTLPAVPPQVPAPVPEAAEDEKKEDATQLTSPTDTANAAPPSKLQLSDPGPSGDSPASPTHEEAFIPPTDPNGRPKIAGEEPMTALDDKNTAYILLSGVAFAPRTFHALLTRFDQYLETHAAPGSEQAKSSELSTRQALASRQRSTILGTYDMTFSGEEFISWLSDHIDEFNNEWDRCVDAAQELTRMGHLSRVGVVGRGFEPEDDVYFVLKLNPAEGTGVNVAGLKRNLTSYASSASTYAQNNIANAQQYANQSLPNLETKLQTSLSGFSMPAVPSPSSATIPSWAKNYLPAAIASNEPPHIRLRHEANKANELYHAGVSEAEARRLEMEERIERGLRVWERWERERLGVIRSILKHYEVALSKLPKRLAQSDEGTALAVETYNPESDLKALIEGSRTGPFRPRPHIYESLESEVPDVNFGIDLRRWSGETAWKSLVNAPQRPKDAIPEALDGLLAAVGKISADLSDDERRKAWIYEVPLEETHMLRNAINHSQLSVNEITTIAQKFNLPTVCGVIKLWLLELNPPVLGWEGWEDARAIYPSVGADQERDMTSAVTSVVGRLPASHLFTLNAVVKFWKDLIDGTKTEEPDELYIKKLSLSIGRCVLRPQYETELTIQDRTPGLFIADLLLHYDNVFPKLLEEKRNQQERVMPVRKRTALVDQRISRSSMSADLKPSNLLEQQRASLTGLGVASQTTQPTQPPLSDQVGAPIPPTSGPPVQPVPVPTSAPASVPEPAPSTGGPPRMVSPPLSDSPGGPPAHFVSPPDSPIESPAGLPEANVVPPTPQAADRPDTPERFTTPGRTPSPSKANEDPIGLGAAPLGGSGGANLKRNTSGEATRLRGPRVARGPRPPGGHATRGSVNSLAAQFEGKS